MRIALLGLGLIGGSIARALRERDRRPSVRIAAWSPSGAGPAAAASDGIIDDAAPTPAAAIEGAELVILAGPAPVTIAQLDDLAGSWGTALAPGAVITDVASTKSLIAARGEALGLQFIGGHPMAGRESSGYAAAQPDLFEGRPWVVVPTPDQAAVERVEELARSVGARPVRLGAAEHDEAVAAISHLPLVLAAALVEAVAGRPEATRDGWDTASMLAASGWRDMTRLARGDVEMGSGILTTNGPAVAGRLRDLIAVLERWLADLDRDGVAEADVVDRLRAARERLESMPR